MSDVEFKAHIPTVQYGYLEVTSGNAYEIKKALDDPEFQEVFARLAGKTPTPAAEGAGTGPAADASESVVTADAVAEAAAEEAALTPLEKARQRMKKGA